MATAKKTTAKTAKKAASKKAAAKKAVAKQPATKKATAAKRGAKKAAATKTAPKKAAATKTASKTVAPVTGPLKKGELAAMVLDYLAENRGEGYGPSQIAKVLDRSAGAIANALDKLETDGRVRRVQERPRRYRYAKG